MSTTKIETKSDPSNEPAMSLSNGFALLLANQRDGDCLRDASEKLTELVQKMRERLRPGSITLKITISPANGAKVVTITDEITVKMPKEDKEATLMFTSEDGSLTRKNPDQKELVLREVPKTDAPLKEVALRQAQGGPEATAAAM